MTYGAKYAIIKGKQQVMKSETYALYSFPLDLKD